MLDFANTSSNEPYRVFCQRNFLTPHPARFPGPVVEFFIEFLTDETDLVLDPFGGSNVTGAIAERLGRRWLAAELEARIPGRLCRQVLGVQG
jgi:DNA modification methylase